MNGGKAMWGIDDTTEQLPTGPLPVPVTFDDWWALRTQYGSENKDLARDAWFAGQKAAGQEIYRQMMDCATLASRPKSI
jgi:hypothetical protein